MKRDSFSLFSKRPALIALIFYISGIFVSLYSGLSFIYPLALSIGLLVAVIYASAKGMSALSAWLLAALVLSLGWYLTELSSGPFPPNHISNLASPDNRVELVGHIIDEPDYRAERTYLVIEADSVKISDTWIPTFGRLRASIRGNFPCGHSDCLLLHGYLSEPSEARNPGAFNYRAYLKSKEIFATLSAGSPENVTILHKGHSLLSATVSPLRNRITGGIESSLSPLSSALLSGFLLGERADIPLETEELFRKTGTLHLMAVSGSNVALIIAIFAFPLSLIKIPRNIRALILLGIVAFFALLTRLEPSVIRASIMAAVGLSAYGWMRKPDYINLLALAGLIMLLIHPLEIFDVGLQLSFAAAFGIIFALPRFGKLLAPLSGRFSRYLGYLITLLLSTIAAQIAVMPIMIHYFRNLPALGTLANLPIALLAGLASIQGIILIFCNLISSWLAHIVSMPLEWILRLVIICLKYFASLPYANIKTSSISWAAMILIWLLCYIVSVLVLDRRFSKRSVIALLVILNFQIWNNLLTKEDDWRLEFLDLGRNHAWFYSEKDGPVIARYDCFIEQDDVNDILIPYIFDQHKGRLDFLLSRTPQSPELTKLAVEFSPQLLTFGDSAHNADCDTVRDWESTFSAGLRNFRAEIKIVWELSDNRHEQVSKFPAVEIRIGGGSILLSDWTGVEIVRVLEKHQLKLLELPWSAYAQSRSLEAIGLGDPEFLIFSPDQYSSALPYDRAQLTHSRDRIFATSICGAMALCGSDSTITMRTMKPFGP